MKTSLSSLAAAATMALSSCAAPGGSVVIDTCASPRHGHRLHGNHRHVTVVREEVVQKVVDVTPPTPRIEISTEQLMLYERLLLKEGAQRELDRKALEERLKGW